MGVLLKVTLNKSRDGGRRPRRRWLLLAGLLAASVALLHVLPKAPLSDAFPSSRVVLASDGQLLRLTLASDDQFRLWVPLKQIAKPLQQAVLLYEDSWFYWHVGVNPWALTRAMVSTLTGHRRIGGSTITMQLARRLYHIDSRSVVGKLHQALAAIWLECRYSKSDILEAYLNIAPYGGNVEGVGAASLIYWHKPVSDLNLAEAINLAVIPQNPKKRLPESTTVSGLYSDLSTAALQEARVRLAREWKAHHPADERLLDPRMLQLAYKNRAGLPFFAPHAVDYLLRSSTARTIHSTIDLKIQGTVERIVTEYVRSRADVGIANASALLVDTSDMSVKAMVGSADYHSDAILGQVNGVFSKRSPGSTLKPFIYALALDQGLIHSATILKDAPSKFGSYAPENFDGRFAGPIPAQQALIRSRNVPAVALAAQLAKPDLYEFLKLAGVQRMESEAHYGLALVLGGGEVTMEELAQMYVMLANQGRWQPLRYELTHDAPGKPIALLSPEASFITLDMLRQTPRTDTYAPARPSIAWKTGTSWGFHDAWTAGVFGHYVLVVWLGNFDGTPNPALVGIDAAAPMFLRIVDALRVEKFDKGELPYTLPRDLRQIDVCSASGDLPNKECPVTSKAWFIAGKSPIRQSTLHRAVLVDTITGKLACRPGPHTKSEVFEYWSSDMLRLFKQAGMPLRAPPSGSCPDGAGIETGDRTSNVATENGPDIVSPSRAVKQVQRYGKREPIYLQAEATGTGNLIWFADSAIIGSSKAGESIAWMPAQAGRYLLRVVDSEGRADSREVVVELDQ